MDDNGHVLTIVYMSGYHDAKKHYAAEIERLRRENGELRMMIRINVWRLTNGAISIDEIDKRMAEILGEGK